MDNLKFICQLDELRGELETTAQLCDALSYINHADTISGESAASAFYVIRTRLDKHLDLVGGWMTAFFEQGSRVVNGQTD